MDAMDAIARGARPELAASRPADDATEPADRSSEIRIVPTASVDAPPPSVTSLACADGGTSPGASFVEVQLPMKLSHKWVAYACRTANVAKPRWHRVAGLWTTSATGPGGEPESVTITASSDGWRIRVLVESAHHEATGGSTTARRIATAFVTTMRDGMRRRTMIRECYAELRRAAEVRGQDGPSGS